MKLKNLKTFKTLAYVKKIEAQPKNGFLIKKTCIQHKLYSFSKMQFAFLYPKDIKKCFGKLSILSKI